LVKAGNTACSLSIFSQAASKRDWRETNVTFGDSQEHQKSATLENSQKIKKGF
jgi:hypothetical protein